MVKREAESDASCCESNQMQTRRVSVRVTQQKALPKATIGEEAYIEIKPAAIGERSGSPDMWLCRRQGHTHTSHRYWR